MTRDCLLNKKKHMTKNTWFVLIKEPSISIDTMQDLEFAEFLMKKRKYELWPKILAKITCFLIIFSFISKLKLEN